MEDHILVPYDGSPAAKRAVDYAVDVFPAATVTILYVLDPMKDYSRH